MISRSPIRRSWASGRFPAGSERSLQNSSQERHGADADFARAQGGHISAPPRRLMLAPPSGMVGKDPGGLRLTKVLVNVNMERSIGPVQVLISPEKTVRELIAAAMEIYVKEKRRPLLKHIDPNFFELHYSQFSLESKFVFVTNLQWK